MQEAQYVKLINEGNTGIEAEFVGLLKTQPNLQT